MQSCINHISEEEATSSSLIPGDVSIKISAKSLHSQVYSKDCNESVGLYIIATSSTLNSERYIQNARFICTPSGFNAAKEIFFPLQKIKCNIFSYYPYQETGIPEGEQALSVKVYSNQSAVTDYNQSDFMTSFVKDVSSTSKNIELNHEHKLCKLSITIKPDDNTSLEELQKSDPEIIINNVYSEAVYSFENNAFSSKSNIQNIIPNGKWSISNGKLIGKKCILIPQSIAVNSEMLMLYVGKKSYSCRLSENYKLEMGKACELILHFNPQQEINTITPIINDWKEGNSSEITPEEKEEKEIISLADFNFEQSNIFRIMHREKAVAEVCKEYLLADNVCAQAIVIYPITNDVVELKNGLVLQILGKDGDVHGGTVSWNEQSNTLTYIEGEKPPISTFKIASDHSISMNQTDKPLLVSIQREILPDGRGSESIIYPLVKIGTQYWMREDLRTTLYTNGKKVTLKTTQSYSKTTAGYFKNGSYYFYNKAAVITGELAPEGWKIAESSDWEKLINYIRKDASALKANKNRWKQSDFTVSNLSGLQCLPTGIFTKASDLNRSIYSFGNQYVVYWSVRTTHETLSDACIMLRYDTNDIKKASYSDYSGYCIRCVRK